MPTFGSTTSKESRNRTMRSYYWSKKRQAIEHYSESPDGIMRPRCKDCGELDLEVLTLSTTTGLKKIYGYGRQLYENLRKAGYPRGFEVLCFNCQGKRKS